MRLVYIAGPYRATTPWGIRCNIRNAEDLAAKVNEAGMAAVCPHSVYPLFCFKPVHYRLLPLSSGLRRFFGALPSRYSKT